MKAFSGGQLLSAKTSPFKQALTECQCIQYALDKPGVLSVLPGIRSKMDLERILGFLESCAGIFSSLEYMPPVWRRAFIVVM